MTKKETSVSNNNIEHEIVNTQVPSDKNIKLSSDENSYGIFHVVAIAIIVLIFLLKLSSSSTPMKPNHEELSTQTNQTTDTANNTLASQR